jgi:peptidoglycan/LPS O-acetylase OafA/YrhL
MIRSWFSKELLWNFPAWSIQVEWFAYIFLFPIAFYLFHKVASPGRIMIAVLLLLCAQSFISSDLIPGKLMDIIFLFILGSALYRLRVLLPRLEGHWLAYVGLLLLGASISFQLFASSFWMYAGFTSIIFGLSYEQGILNKLLSSRPAVYGGTISYCIYMTHELVHKACSTILAQLTPVAPLSRYAALVGLFLAVIIAASASYHFIERSYSTMAGLALMISPLKSVWLGCTLVPRFLSTPHPCASALETVTR